MLTLQPQPSGRMVLATTPGDGELRISAYADEKAIKTWKRIKDTRASRVLT